MGVMVLSLSLTFGVLGANTDEDLQRGFVQPPDSARPSVYWFWVDGNITRAGITADLESMQRVGIGGVLLMDVTSEVPPGPVRFFSPEWRELFKHAMAEATRLGLKVNLHNAGGFTGSGGPWISPELGMQKTVASKTNLAGPATYSGPLPRLPGAQGPGRDIAVLAFPALVGEGGSAPGFSPKITSSGANALDGSKLLDHNAATFVNLPWPNARQSQFLQLEFAAPFTASMLKLSGTGHAQAFKGVLQISDDGFAFRDVREFTSLRSGIVLSFEQLAARFFRIVFSAAEPGLSHLEFSELEMAPLYRIELAQPKAGLGSLPPLPRISQVPPQGVIAPEKVLDISSLVDPEGRLTWEVPPGRWTVLRFGFTPTGTQNHPARAGGAGLECDKLSREAIEAHFNAYLAPLLADAGDAVGKSLTSIHVDSWELGFQNWTPRFREEFQRRRGYDPLRYLPAMTGRFVGDAEQTERFLWDVRRTVADLFAENYAGHLAELAHQHGVELSIEAYCSQGKGPFDNLLYAASADVPMSEFWRNEEEPADIDLGGMPSAAHTGGKAIVAAEAFTSYPASAKWQEHPFALKPLADAAFCAGINRLVIHRFAHQPWLDQKPGMTLGQWGSHYERTQTWWEQSRAWHQYLSRCQYLLQQGLFAADLCYLTREGAYTEPPNPNELEPPVPNGFRYDVASPKVVLTRMSVRDGRLVLADGMSYTALVLPPDNRMTPELIHKIKELVEAGATVVGPRPAKSPSLDDYPRCDMEVQKIATELWGACDGKAITEQRTGKGTLFWGKSLAQVLAGLGVVPDFEQLGTMPSHALRYIHRRLANTDIYFIANSSQQSIKADCLFRVTNKLPEIWHPDTGELERPAIWRPQPTRTLVPLQFDPGGSLFVVFRETSIAADPLVGLTRDNKTDGEAHVTVDPNGKLQLLSMVPGSFRARTAAGKEYTTQINPLPERIKLDTDWQLSFPAHLGAPEHLTLARLMSWSEHPDKRVKYFSGTATYFREFQIPAQSLSTNRRVILDLGKVQVIAQPIVNGHDFGTLWKPPFRVDITDAVKQGRNTVEVRVVNLWPNRLIGDEQLPEDCVWLPASGSAQGVGLAEWPQWLRQAKPRPSGRLTFATWKHWTKDSRLFDSGLLGPVTLQFPERIELR
jgi:hypothetical protein